MRPGRLWLCYAVRQEMIRPTTSPIPKIILTGMGPVQARRTLEQTIRREPELPVLVLSCGFAGGLNPRWRPGDVLFEAPDDFPWRDDLRRAGASPATFHASEHIICRATDKTALWNRTRTDAVEMESRAIRLVCQTRRIPCATVRVISDAADQDLPIDFNSVLTADGQLHRGKLLWRLLLEPGLTKGLIHLQRGSRAAAVRLAEVLRRAVDSISNPVQD